MSIETRGYGQTVEVIKLDVNGQEVQTVIGFTGILSCLNYEKVTHATTRTVNGVVQLHSTTGPALILANGAHIWFRNNLISCGDGPAVVCPCYDMIGYFDCGTLSRRPPEPAFRSAWQELYVNNGRFSVSKDSHVNYREYFTTPCLFPNGSGYTEGHSRAGIRVHALLSPTGLLHNTEGPALCVFFRKTQTLQAQFHFKRGALHRTKGPAALIYDTDGNIVLKAHYKNDVLHSMQTEPTLVCYSGHPGHSLVQYWLQGKRVHKPPDGLFLCSCKGFHPLDQFRGMLPEIECLFPFKFILSKPCD